MQRGAWAVAAVVLVIVVVLSGTPGLAIAQQDSSPTDNGTDAEPTPPPDQHENPRNTSEEGDIARLSAWLEGHLAGRLEEGMVQLSRDQYELVDGLLGDEFESRLSQYVDVAGDTASGDDDSAANQMDDVVETQRSFSESVRQYRETLADYREARDRGENATARTLARQLEDLATEIRQDGDSLRDGYRSLENLTNRNLTTGIETLEGIVANVSRTQSTIRSVTFVETELVVSANRTTAAFDRPVEFRGQLRVANGSTLSNRSISLRVGHRRSSVRTDADGQFSVTYRPVTIPVDVDAVPVVYQPQAQSVYLPTTANVSMSIEPVEPRVAITTVPDTGRFAKPIPIEASVSVNGRPVPNAPTSAAIEGYVLDRSTSAGAGTVNLTGSLPAAIQEGSRSLVVSAGQAGRAVSIGSATTSIEVAETPTTLSIETEPVGNAVLIEGRLATTDGESVPGQSITIDAGSTTETVGTDESGGYSLRVDGTEIGEAGEQRTITARFDGSGTNLEGVTASTTVQVPAVDETEPPGGAESSGGPLRFDEGEYPIVAGGLVALVLLAAVGLGYWRWNASPDSADSPDASISDDAGRPDSVDDAALWLGAARESLKGGDERSTIVRSYAASYAGVRDQLGLTDDKTPRELLVEAESQLDATATDALRSVIDAYERVAFADTEVDRPESILDNAAVVVNYSN